MGDMIEWCRETTRANVQRIRLQMLTVSWKLVFSLDFVINSGNDHFPEVHLTLGSALSDLYTQYLLHSSGSASIGLGVCTAGSCW